MKATKKVISGIVRMVTKAEAAPWPPFCIGVLYQPERPVAPHKGSIEPSLRTKNELFLNSDMCGQKKI